MHLLFIILTCLYLLIQVCGSFEATSFETTSFQTSSDHIIIHGHNPCYYEATSSLFNFTWIAEKNILEAISEDAIRLRITPSKENITYRIWFGDNCGCFRSIIVNHNPSFPKFTHYHEGDLARNFISNLCRNY